MNGNISGYTSIPLREWIECEAKKQSSASAGGITNNKNQQSREVAILRKTTVAYGIAELLRHARDHPPISQQQKKGGDTTGSGSEEQFKCSIDNFVVRMTPSINCEGTAWNNNISGVDMIHPRGSVNIVEPSFLRSSFTDADGGGTYSLGESNGLGRYLEVEFPEETKNGTNDQGIQNATAAFAVIQREEDNRCYSLGVLLYELFSHIDTRQQNRKSEGTIISSSLQSSDDVVSSGGQQPTKKRIRLLDSSIPADEANDHDTMAQSSSSMQIAQPLVELGFPSSICLVVQNLLDCGDEDNLSDEAYGSLEAVIKDLHLLLLDPSRFLFSHEMALASAENNNAIHPELLFRENKLYGRENEVSLITDAFCRVSTGKSEAFFIGGFSGSGKSMLVNSLKARVDMAEGYVLIHQFDQMSKERPLLEVISVFNDLCPLIRDRSSEVALQDIVKNLLYVFGNDFSVLAQLLPNIETLSPQFKLAVGDKDTGDHMNLQSICFTLRRFMRVVSSKRHPVMLFLDDLQWCDNSALSVVEGILADPAVSSSCLFFVGSYRSNEVKWDHAIFPLMDSLRSSSVPITTISLEGLLPQDLNTMISDALCMFPRICEPLSDIIYQKTKGNPFFVLAFLRSLVDKSLLKFCRKKERWVWDEDSICSMDITGNVLHLLSSKMSGLSGDIQSALKVAAMFGKRIKGSVVEYLSSNPEYTNLHNSLEEVVKEEYMIKVGKEFKFVHDKVREAAYSLIPDNGKDQFHYNLGVALYKITKGKDVDDIVFSIADQINHGLDDSFTERDVTRLELAELNENAGAKAVKCSDFETARSYFKIAYSQISLLPDMWETHYDFSLRLLFQWAKSAYSCGDVEKARDILQEILSKCQSIQDKLPAYYLLVTILHAYSETNEAYNTCHEVLSQLGEKIPPSPPQPKEMTTMIDETKKTLNNISDVDLMEMKEMDTKLSTPLKFYTLMALVAFFVRPRMMPFLACRTVQITMKYGLSKHSVLGFVQFAYVLCSMKMADIQFASRMGEAAISCYKKRFQTTELLPKLYHNYYGCVAVNTEPLLLCAGKLRQAFDAGMSLGESHTAFFNAIADIKIALFAGERLNTLLERVDYYLELADQYKNELTKMYMSIFRDTVSALIDKGESTSTKSNSSDTLMENALKFSKNSEESVYFHKAIQAYWLGHNERCQHYFGKMLQITAPNSANLKKYEMCFIHGLNSFQMLKRQNTGKLRSIPKNAILTLREATSNSRWNFRNKVHLLEAENFSFQGNHEEAKASYAAAISSARCSRIINEQGLACELAAYHCKKIGDNMSSWNLFNQAKQCYVEWGSQMKVDSVTRQLELLHATPAGSFFM